MPTPKPESNFLASKATEFIDSIFTLASSKSPINLSPLQIGYDMANHAISACETLIVNPTAAVINKARESLTGIFK